MNWNNYLPCAPAIIKLITGTVYTYHKEWDILLMHRSSVEEYFEQIGIQVEVFEQEGFAYLGQPRFDELDEETQIFLKNTKKVESIPILIQRKPLSDEQTLLCILLREKFDEVDDNIISKQAIIDLMRDFFKEKLNKPKEEKHFHQLIKGIVELGFLTSLDIQGSDEFYKIEKIIRAKIDVDKIEEIKNKLILYYGSL